jgi:hypothetical protein
MIKFSEFQQNEFTGRFPNSAKNFRISSQKSRKCLIYKDPRRPTLNRKFPNSMAISHGWNSVFSEFAEMVPNSQKCTIEGVTLVSH